MAGFSGGEALNVLEIHFYIKVTGTNFPSNVKMARTVVMFGVSIDQ